MKVLVVCLGNINRSPVAAAVLRAERPDWEIREAALKAWNNPKWRPERAAKKMRVAALERHGINLEDHRSRAIEEEDLEWADIVLFMDGGNHKRLLTMRPDGPGSGKGWISLGTFTGLGRIADPNFMRAGSDEFMEVLDQVVTSSRAAAQDLIAPSW